MLNPPLWTPSTLAHETGIVTTIEASAIRSAILAMLEGSKACIVNHPSPMSSSVEWNARGPGIPQLRSPDAQNTSALHHAIDMPRRDCAYAPRTADVLRPARGRLLNESEAVVMGGLRF